MKKLTRTEMKKIAGGGPSGGPAKCVALGGPCGDCTDPFPTDVCCDGLVCSGGGIIAGQCINPKQETA